jgi:hypothetical protein
LLFDGLGKIRVSFEGAAEERDLGFPHDELVLSTYGDELGDSR